MAKSVKTKPFVEKCFYSDPNQPFTLWSLYDDFYESVGALHETEADVNIVETTLKECLEQVKRIDFYMSLNAPLTSSKLVLDLTRYFIGLQRVTVLICRHLRRHLGEEAFQNRVNAFASQQILKKHAQEIARILKKAFIDSIQAESCVGPAKVPFDRNALKILECINRVNQPEIYRLLVTQTLLDVVQYKSIFALPEASRSSGQRNWAGYLSSVQDVSKQLYFSLYSILCTQNRFVLGDYCIFNDTQNGLSLRPVLYDYDAPSNITLNLNLAVKIKQIMDNYRSLTYHKYSGNIFADFVEAFIKKVKPFDKYSHIDLDTRVLNLLFMFNSPDTETYGHCLETSLKDPSTSSVSVSAVESYTKLQSSRGVNKVKGPKESLTYKLMSDFVAVIFHTFTKRYSTHEKVLQSAPRSLDQWHYSVFHLLTYFQRFMTIVSHKVFYNSYRFFELWRPRMIELVNMRPGHTQCDSIYKCLVFFAHRSLNTSKQCDPSTIEVIGQSMHLYPYFKEKEFFENWYRTKLANRLLSPIQVYLPDELRIVRSMINQIDIGYVNGLETMINDLDVSIQKTAIFNRNDEPELRVCALNDFFWKSSLPVQPEIGNLLPCYRQFTTRIKETYALIHPHRTLTFIFNASWVIIEYGYGPHDSCRLLMTFQQHLIMEEILKSDPNPIKLNQIETIFKNIFTTVEIRRALQLLTKFEMINKKDVKEVEYCINKGFINKSKASLLNMKGLSSTSINNRNTLAVINLTSLRQGSSLEAFGKIVPKAKTNDSVDVGNRWMVEACIIRVLKTEKSKSLDYRELRQIVVEQLRHKYNRHVDWSIIQLCVQKLKKERYLVSQNTIFDGIKPNTITYLP